MQLLSCTMSNYWQNLIRLEVHICLISGNGNCTSPYDDGLIHSIQRVDLPNTF